MVTALPVSADQNQVIIIINIYREYKNPPAMTCRQNHAKEILAHEAQLNVQVNHLPWFYFVLRGSILNSFPPSLDIFIICK